ncbi:hypothetical protein EF902_07280 [Streptomyces sp. WAC05858]|nr:hypothetical protein EF902_07280 [Streptomyces sp. WAC05858]
MTGMTHHVKPPDPPPPPVPPRPVSVALAPPPPPPPPPPAPHAWMCTEVTPAGGVKVPSAVNSWTPWMMDGGRGGLGRPPPRVSSA